MSWTTERLTAHLAQNPTTAFSELAELFERGEVPPTLYDAVYQSLNSRLSTDAHYGGYEQSPRVQQSRIPQVPFRFQPIQDEGMLEPDDADTGFDAFPSTSDRYKPTSTNDLVRKLEADLRAKFPSADVSLRLPPQKSMGGDAYATVNIAGQNRMDMRLWRDSTGGLHLGGRSIVSEPGETQYDTLRRLVLRDVGAHYKAMSTPGQTESGPRFVAGQREGQYVDPFTPQSNYRLGRIASTQFFPETQNPNDRIFNKRNLVNPDLSGQFASSDGSPLGTRNPNDVYGFDTGQMTYQGMMSSRDSRGRVSYLNYKKPGDEMKMMKHMQVSGYRDVGRGMTGGRLSVPEINTRIVEYAPDGSPVTGRQAQVFNILFDPSMPAGMGVSVGQQVSLERQTAWRTHGMAGQFKNERFWRGTVGGRDTPVPHFGRSTGSWDETQVGATRRIEGGMRDFLETAVRQRVGEGNYGLFHEGSKVFVAHHEQNYGFAPRGFQGFAVSPNDFFKNPLAGVQSMIEGFGAREGWDHPALAALIDPSTGAPQWTESNLPAIQQAARYIISNSAKTNAAGQQVMSMPFAKTLSRSGAWPWSTGKVSMEVAMRMAKTDPRSFSQLSRQSIGKQDIYGEIINAGAVMSGAPNITPRRGIDLDASQLPEAALSSALQGHAGSGTPTPHEFLDGLESAMGFLGEMNGASKADMRHQARSPLMMTYTENGVKQSLPLPSVRNLRYALGGGMGKDLANDDGFVGLENDSSTYATSALEMLMLKATGQEVPIELVQKHRASVAEMYGSKGTHKALTSFYPRNATGGPVSALPGVQDVPINEMRLGDAQLMRMFKVRTPPELLALKSYLRENNVGAYTWRNPNISDANLLNLRVTPSNLPDGILLNKEVQSINIGDFDPDASGISGIGALSVQRTGRAFVVRANGIRPGMSSDEVVNRQKLMDEKFSGLGTQEINKWAKDAREWGFDKSTGKYDFERLKTSMLGMVDKLGTFGHTTPEAVQKALAETLEYKAGMGKEFNFGRVLSVLSGGQDQFNQVVLPAYQKMLDSEAFSGAFEKLVAVRDRMQPATAGVAPKPGEKVSGIMTKAAGGGRNAGMTDALTALMTAPEFSDASALVPLVINDPQKQAFLRTQLAKAQGMDASKKAGWIANSMGIVLGRDPWGEAGQLGTLPTAIKAMAAARWKIEKAPLGDKDADWAEFGMRLHETVRFYSGKPEPGENRIDLPNTLANMIVAPQAEDFLQRFGRLTGMAINPRATGDYPVKGETMFGHNTLATWAKKLNFAIPKLSNASLGNPDNLLLAKIMPTEAKHLRNLEKMSPDEARRMVSEAEKKVGGGAERFRQGQSFINPALYDPTDPNFIPKVAQATASYSKYAMKEQAEQNALNEMNLGPQQTTRMIQALKSLTETGDFSTMDLMGMRGAEGSFARDSVPLKAFDKIRGALQAPGRLSEPSVMGSLKNIVSSIDPWKLSDDSGEKAWFLEHGPEALGDTEESVKKSFADYRAGKAGGGPGGAKTAKMTLAQAGEAFAKADMGGMIKESTELTATFRNMRETGERLNYVQARQLKYQDRLVDLTEKQGKFLEKHGVGVGVMADVAGGNLDFSKDAYPSAAKAIEMRLGAVSPQVAEKYREMEMERRQLFLGATTGTRSDASSLERFAKRLSDAGILSGEAVSQAEAMSDRSPLAQLNRTSQALMSAQYLPWTMQQVTAPALEALSGQSQSNTRIGQALAGLGFGGTGLATSRYAGQFAQAQAGVQYAMANTWGDVVSGVSGMGGNNMASVIGGVLGPGVGMGIATGMLTAPILGPLAIPAGVIAGGVTSSIGAMSAASHYVKSPKDFNEMLYNTYGGDKGIGQLSLGDALGGGVVGQWLFSQSAGAQQMVGEETQVAAGMSQFDLAGMSYEDRARYMRQRAVTGVGGYESTMARLGVDEDVAVGISTRLARAQNYMQGPDAWRGPGKGGEESPVEFWKGTEEKILRAMQAGVDPEQFAEQLQAGLGGSMDTAYQKSYAALEKYTPEQMRAASRGLGMENLLAMEGQEVNFDRAIRSGELAGRDKFIHGLVESIFGQLEEGLAGGFKWSGITEFTKQADLGTAEGDATAYGLGRQGMVQRGRFESIRSMLEGQGLANVDNFSNLLAEDPQRAGRFGQLFQASALDLGGAGAKSYALAMSGASSYQRSLGENVRGRLGQFMGEQGAADLAVAMRNATPQEALIAQGVLSGNANAMSMAGAQMGGPGSWVTNQTGGRTGSAGMSLFTNSILSAGGQVSPLIAGSFKNFSAPVQAALVGQGKPNAVGQTYGGMWGLQDYMSDLSYQSQAASSGISARGVKIGMAFTTGQGLGAYAGSAVYKPGEALPWSINGGTASAIQEGRGMWALQDESTQLQRTQAQGNLAFSQRGLEMRGRQFQAGWDFNRAQAVTQQGWQQEDFSFRGQQVNLQRGYQLEDFSFGRMQSAQSRNWQSQDFAFQRGQNQQHFGWAMEDIDEDIRFSTGRDRRQLERQKKRTTLDHNAEETQQNKVESRQRKLWKDEDDRYKTETVRAAEQFKTQVERLAVEQNRSEEMFKLSMQRMDMEKGNFYENQALESDRIAAQRGWLAESEAIEDEQRNLERTHWKLQQENQLAGIGSGLHYAKLMKDAQAAATELGRKQGENEAGLRYMMDTSAKFYNGVGDWLWNMFQWLGNASLEDAANVAHPPNYVPPATGGSSNSGGEEAIPVASGRQFLATKNQLLRVGEYEDEYVSIYPLNSQPPDLPRPGSSKLEGNGGYGDVYVILDGDQIAARIERRQAKTLRRQSAL